MPQKAQRSCFARRAVDRTFVSHQGTRITTRTSSACYTAGFVEFSDVLHNFTLDGITVSISNDVFTAPVYDLVTDASGDIELTVPNGLATVSAPNLVDLGFNDLAPELIDFGLGGSDILDVGTRMLLPPYSEIFADGFESSDLSAWSSSL